MEKISFQVTREKCLNDSDVLEAMQEFGSYLDISPDDFRAIYTNAYAKARARIFEGIKARDIMSHPVITIPCGTTVRQAVELLDDRNISGVPVVDEADQLVGILSETDIARLSGSTKRASLMHLLRMVLKHTFSPQQLDIPVERIMTRDVVCVPDDISLVPLLTIMQEKNVKRLPVKDSKGHLVGLVSRGDLLTTLGSIR